jgi:uncharacterized protein (TIGR00297 family)
VKWLTRSGRIAALAVGGAVVTGYGWRGVVVLFAFFISGSALTQLSGGADGARTARQVLANGGVAALAALLGWWPALAGALAAAAADTWATEIGSFSPSLPRLLTTFAPVPPGTSGGVTPLGTAGGVAGAAALAGVALLVRPSGTPAAFAGAMLAGVTGMVVDSALGSTLQAKYACLTCGARSERAGAQCHGPMRLMQGRRWIDNDLVNAAATLIGAGVGAVLA